MIAFLGAMKCCVRLMMCWRCQGACNLKTGVYAIRNRVNQKRYVGSAAKSLDSRWYFHRWELRNRSHGNRHLQAAWNKYGEGSFVFEVLEKCEPEVCLEREQYWIDVYQSCNDKRGYNICPAAGSRLGAKHTDKTRAKLARLSHQQMMSKAQEERSKMARAASKRRWMGHAKKVRVKLTSEEVYRRRVEANQRPERIAKIKAAWRRRGFRARQSAVHKGKVWTEEHKRNHTAAMKSSEVRAKISKSHKGLKLSPKVSARMTARRLAKISPEKRREIGRIAAAARWGK